jgi:hypothetical protein
MARAVGILEQNPVFPGEKHVKSYNFLGPGSALDERSKVPVLNTPINAIDASAKKHDYAYKAIGESKASQPEKLKMAHQADDEFIAELQALPGMNLTKTLAMNAIRLKKQAEKLGLLDPKEFTLNGAGLLPPAHKLKREMSGGLFPVLIPIVASILGSLASKGIDMLYDKLTKKKQQSGSGLVPEQKRRAVAEMLDLLPYEKQIQMVSAVVQ